MTSESDHGKSYEALNILLFDPFCKKTDDQQSPPSSWGWVQRSEVYLCAVIFTFFSTYGKIHDNLVVQSELCGNIYLFIVFTYGKIDDNLVVKSEDHFSLSVVFVISKFEFNHQYYLRKLGSLR